MDGIAGACGGGGAGGGGPPASGGGGGGAGGAAPVEDTASGIGGGGGGPVAVPCGDAIGGEVTHSLVAGDDASPLFPSPSAVAVEGLAAGFGGAIVPNSIDASSLAPPPGPRETSLSDPSSSDESIADQSSSSVEGFRRVRLPVNWVVMGAVT